MAEAVLCARLKQLGMQHTVQVDSAGIRASQLGHRPDPRAKRAVECISVDLGRIRARQIKTEDFHKFDFILGMDNEHVRSMHAKCDSEQRHKIRLLMSFAGSRAASHDIPDPYFGNYQSFEKALEMIVEGVNGFTAELSQANQ
jgi:protein-tyrosine phosphatase